MLIGLTSFVNSRKIDFCCTLVRVRVSTKIKGKNSCSHFFAFVHNYLSTVGWAYLRICLWESVWHRCVLHLLNNNWNDKKKDIKLLFTNIIVIIFQICALLKTAFHGAFLHRENFPSHFKFKEYCPLVFKQLRERFGVDDSQYVVSIVSWYCILSYYDLVPW